MATDRWTLGPSLRGFLLTLVTLLAFGLRMLRLEWQPLWWDEGYSVFFATEPLAHMVALTARDIHPPFYYAALHGWLSAIGSTGPIPLRLFSIGAGVAAIPLVAALAGRLGKQNAAAAIMAALLLALNPLHIYYSQEIRMYSLATSLGLAASVCIVTYVLRLREGRRTAGWLLAFVVSTLLMIHTLYYAAVLTAVHFLWATWMLRSNRRGLMGLALGGGAVLLFALPWTAYAAPKLAEYIANKVASDQDAPLQLGDYLWRHAIAFVVGHGLHTSWVVVVVWSGVLLLLFLTTRSQVQNHRYAGSQPSLAASAAFLVLSLAAALFTGFVANRLYPFFPAGGERLLLFALPYLLALIALGFAYSGLKPLIRLALLAPLLAVSVAGILDYYSQPRHTEHDYRAIVATVEERGTESDSVLALFPWQVGYWRAYGRRDGDGRLVAPQPRPVGQEILVWDETLRSAVDSALQQGTLWFPEPLALGSTLPLVIEEYLSHNALSVENQWQTESTRLTAWTGRPPAGVMIPIGAAFGPITLSGHGVLPQSVPSDNSIIPVSLDWENAVPDSTLGVALKLMDREGRVWSERDYTPPGRFALFGEPASPLTVDQVGVQSPAGTPPGVYTMTLSVLDAGGAALAMRSGEGPPVTAIPLQAVEIVAPERPLSPVRIGMDAVTRDGRAANDFEILGFSGIGEHPSVLAGDDFDIQIVLKNISHSPPLYELAVDLHAQGGGVIAEWRGWPLMDYPTNVWREGSIVRVPVSLQVPADSPDGNYALRATLVEPGADIDRRPAELEGVEVHSRPARSEPIIPEIGLPAPVQFGTHARLIGYDAGVEGDKLELTLHWEAMQPLLPQHDVFVHVVDDEGTAVAQGDGPPVTEFGAAPTGSWRAGEVLLTIHEVALPHGTPTTASPDVLRLRVGLYDPKTGVRLPAAVDGMQAGDSAELHVGG